MLVLDRKTSERIFIFGPESPYPTKALKIEIKVLAIYSPARSGEAIVKLGIEAPLDLSVHREEVFYRIRQEKDGGLPKIKIIKRRKIEGGHDEIIKKVGK